MIRHRHWVRAEANGLARGVRRVASLAFNEPAPDRAVDFFARLPSACRRRCPLSLTTEFTDSAAMEVPEQCRRIAACGRLLDHGSTISAPVIPTRALRRCPRPGQADPSLIAGHRGLRARQGVVQAVSRDPRVGCEIVAEAFARSPRRISCGRWAAGGQGYVPARPMFEYIPRRDHQRRTRGSARSPMRRR